MNGSAFIAVWSLINLTALGQGTVYLANRIPGQTISVDAPFFDEQGIRLEGSDYIAQLYAWKPGEGFLAVGRSTPFQTNGYFESIGITVRFVKLCVSGGESPPSLSGWSARSSEWKQ